MAITLNRIDQTRTTTSLPTSEDAKVGNSSTSTRVELHTESTFEVTSDSAVDASQFQNTNLTDDQRRGATERLASLSTDDQDQVNSAVSTLKSAVSSVSDGTGTLDDARAALASAVSTYQGALQSTSAAASSTTSADSSTTGALSSTTSAQDGASVVNDVLSYTITYMENETEEMAEDLNTKIEAKNDLRTESTELSEMISDWPDDGSTQSYTWNSYEVDDDGNVYVQTNTKELTKEEAEALQEDLEGQLETLDDYTQLQQLELQDAYQDQQQAMSTLSQILSSMHDTMKNTINNTKAS